jgi:hypothetical protein
MPETQPVSHEKSAPRWIENLHIFLWLIKDTCWATAWRPGGIFMIIPTISVAIYLLFRSRKNRTDLYHNAAVCMWISANSIWMVGEFFNKDLRPMAVVFFGLGLAILLIYYIFYFRTDNRTEKELDTQ